MSCSIQAAKTAGTTKLHTESKPDRVREALRLMPRRPKSRSKAAA